MIEKEPDTDGESRFGTQAARATLNIKEKTKMSKIRIGIAGYGNLGKGVEMAIRQNDDMELVCVFTRRDPASVSIKTPGVEVVSMDDMASMKDKIDVVILCGGSAITA